MERYQTYSVEPIKCVRLSLRHYKKHKVKEFDLHQGDFVSILYIDSLNNVGEGKEYQLDGRIADIRKNTDSKYTDSAYITEIILDCGTPRKAKVVKLYACNILDIAKYPYKFDLDENPELVPRIIDGFVVNEIKTPQMLDVGMGNYNPLTRLNLNDRIFGEERSYE